MSDISGSSSTDVILLGEPSMRSSRIDGFSGAEEAFSLSFLASSCSLKINYNLFDHFNLPFWAVDKILDPQTWSQFNPIIVTLSFFSGIMMRRSTSS
jgi:hypothetical protein